jgi:hypothetical protein
MAERATEHLEDLRQELRLTSEQQAAWDRFVNTVQETIARVRPPPGGTLSSGWASEQGITAYDTTLDAHLGAIRTIRDALSDLTSSLNGAQTHKLVMETAALLARAKATEGNE